MCVVNSHIGQLSVGVIAQCVCTSIAGHGFRIPFKPEFFSGFLFATAYVAYTVVMVFHLLIFHLQFTYMIFHIFFL